MTPPLKEPIALEAFTASLNWQFDTIARMANTERTFHGLLAKYGKAWTGEIIPSSYAKWAKPKECFGNAFHAMGWHGGHPWAYCEGFATDSKLAGIPIHHAWLVNVETGEVMDPTPSWCDKVDPLYFGIAFKPDYVVANAMETGWPSPIFNGYFFNPEIFDKDASDWLAAPLDQ